VNSFQLAVPGSSSEGGFKRKEAREGQLEPSPIVAKAVSRPRCKHGRLWQLHEMGAERGPDAQAQRRADDAQTQGLGRSRSCPPTLLPAPPTAAPGPEAHRRGGCQDHRAIPGTPTPESLPATWGHLTVLAVLIGTRPLRPTSPGGRTLQEKAVWLDEEENREETREPIAAVPVLLPV